MTRELRMRYNIYVGTLRGGVWVVIWFDAILPAQIEVSAG